jgi:hypothetical protein
MLPLSRYHLAVVSILAQLLCTLGISMHSRKRCWPVNSSRCGNDAPRAFPPVVSVNTEDAPRYGLNLAPVTR